MNAFYPPTTLVVVDPTVRDYRSLIDYTHPADEILILDAEQDGVQQITDALATRSGLTSLHILSHGESGTLLLGKTQLNLANLETYAAQIKRWVRSIGDRADILLYGCKVASGAVGQQFVRRLSQLTGATIAASANLTGNKALGGDWNLEFSTGVVRTPLAFPQAAMAAYPHVLQIPVVFLQETFTGEDVTPKNWLFGVDDPDNSDRLQPFLTARSTVANPIGGLQGNPGPGPTPPSSSYPPVDTPGQGALRLTNVLTDQAAYVLYNEPIRSNRGLTISFDFFMYGGTGADGISFFLADATDNPPTRAGAFGGSLGYAQRTSPTEEAGLPNGFLGIGFDAFGNFSNETEGRVGGRPAPGDGRTPDAIAIRGSAANGYNYLVGTPSLSSQGVSLDVPNATNREEALRSAVIDITPAGVLSIKVDFNGDGNFDGPGETPPELQDVNLLDLIDINTVPEFVTFGFAASTGDQTNVHEIRNLLVSTFRPEIPPIVASFPVNIPQGTTTAIGPIPANDADGFITSVIVTNLPDPVEGQLFVGNPAQGGRLAIAGEQLTVAQADQLFFVPAATFTGGGFTLVATDDDGLLSDPATVSLVRLTPPNGIPSAEDFSIDVAPGVATPIGVIPATDPDGTISTIVVATLPDATEGQLFVGDPAQGGRAAILGEQLSVADANQLFFVPTAAFTGAAFTYFATDNLGTFSNVATGTFLLLGEPPGLAPTADNVSVPVQPGVNTPLGTIPASDADGFITSIVIATLPPPDQGQLFVGDPAQGRLVTLGEQLSVADANQLVFVPGAGFTGATFTYFATDDDGLLSNVATVTLTDTDNLPPIAGDLVVPFTPDANNPIGAIPASDPDGFITSIVIATLPQPAQGQLFVGDPANGRLVTLGEQLTVEEANQLVFLPAPGAAGGLFTYFATDDLGVLSNVATVTLGTLGEPTGDCEPGIFEQGDAGNNQLTGTAGIDTLIGAGGNDTLRGLDCPDILLGGNGNDVIFGGEGDDFARGGAGNDRLNGNPGNDTLFGDRGNDTIRGGPGDDSLLGGVGRDLIRGGDGDDFINGNQGNDRLFGENGDDTIFGGLGRDQIDGGRGNDSINGGRGNDTLRGRGGNDTIFGGRSDDSIRGGANNDVLYGNQGNDTIRGENGNDLIFGGLGRDRLFGDQGNDTLYGGRGNDTLKGGAGADVLFGVRSRNSLNGGAGPDTIVGGTGNDTITGGGGADLLSGGGGSNRFVYRNFQHGGDVITDFNVARDDFFMVPLFRGAQFSQRSNPFAYIRPVQAGSDTVIQVDTGNESFINYITLLNVQSDSLRARNFITT
jgi:Ca2+-binding RTX toxin-like protein